MGVPLDGSEGYEKRDGEREEVFVDLERYSTSLQASLEVVSLRLGSIYIENGLGTSSFVPLSRKVRHLHRTHNLMTTIHILSGITKQLLMECK